MSFQKSLSSTKAQDLKNHRLESIPATNPKETSSTSKETQESFLSVTLISELNPYSDEFSHDQVKIFESGMKTF
jgi:hypothetical protein